MAAPRRVGVAGWLAGQAIAFGAMAALLGIVANAMFLDAYGASWLPATYVAIGVVGVLVSGTVAGTAQRFDLVRISLVVLGGAAAGIAAAWAVARDGDAPWVSIPLLVLFPVLIQLGFVFIGAQAGRLLDIAGLKASFPRIMTGFPVGAVAGGVVGGQLAGWLGRAEDLLLVTAIAQAAFAALVWLTARGRGSARRRDGTRAAGAADAADARRDDAGRSPAGVRRLLAGRFVALLLAYQVLSALGSQLADYLVFDRAGARFTDPAELARYLAWYTAAMNVASIGFLFLVAAPLLRRFGLRLGIPANPWVLGAFSVAMLAVWTVAGPASTALLLTVSAARIADIALTDGTTRTSIQVAFQALPERTRLGVQATIEGMGVPIAISVTGVLILGLNLLPDPLAATLLVTTLTCAAWSWIAVLLYRAYGPALVAALRRQPLLVPAERLEASAADEAVARDLLAGPDPRAARLGTELLAAMASPALAPELGALALDPRPDVRTAALAGLVTLGDTTARGRLADEAREAAGSPDVADRTRAAVALQAIPGGEPVVLVRLLRDPDAGVREAALGAVRGGGEAGTVEAVLEALGDGPTAGAAASAADRLGDAVLPGLAERLGRPTVPADLVTVRLVRALATRTPARDALLRRHVSHPDRDLGRVIMERLVGTDPADAATGAALDASLREDLAHAGRIHGALAALRPRPAEGPDAVTRDGDRPDPLVRALVEELELVRDRVVAGRLARHGRAALGPAMLALGGEDAERGMAMEAIGVLLAPEEARAVVAVVSPAGDPGGGRAHLPAPPGAPVDVAGWVRDLVEDRGGAWRSPWLRACAIRAARDRGELASLDLGPARAVGDPLIEEELAIGASA
jgi:hypothetical protein